MAKRCPRSRRSSREQNPTALKMVESMPMGQFARFPGVEIPAEALEQLIALSVASAEPAA